MPCAVFPRIPVPDALVPMKFPLMKFPFDGPLEPIDTPVPVLPEITFRSAAVEPPIMLPFDPPCSSTPPLAFGIAAVPAAFVPIKFPRMSLFEAGCAKVGSNNETPVLLLPEMTLPMTWLPDTLMIKTPWILLLVAPAVFVALIETDPLLPEIKLHAPVQDPPGVVPRVPPIRLFDAP